MMVCLIYRAMRRVSILQAGYPSYLGLIEYSIHNVYITTIEITIINEVVFDNQIMV